MRPFMMEANAFDSRALLGDWQWLLPPALKPLMVSAFGDWVLGAPDGSLWLLSMLEGSFELIAADAAEFNTLKSDPAWFEETFLAGWFDIAVGNGLEPSESECLGWKVHPLIGGEFSVNNLQVFSLRLYVSLMGQLHRQLRPAAPR